MLAVHGRAARLSDPAPACYAQGRPPITRSDGAARCVSGDPGDSSEGTAAAGARLTDGMGPRPGYIARVRALVASSPKRERSFYAGYVTRTAGAAMAVALEDTRATPNSVTLLGLAVHTVAALVLAMAALPIEPAPWIAVLLLWQIGFALDGADGQLARLRRRASAFGAWLDTWADVVTHVLVYGALALYVARALGFDGTAAVLFTAILFGCHLTQLVAGWQHVRVRTEPAIERPSPLLARAMRAIHLLDYGWFLLVAAALLPWPVALWLFLIISSGLHAAAAVVQLALNWRRELRDQAGGAPARSTETTARGAVTEMESGER